MNKLLERNNIDDKYKWNLNDIYKNDELFEKDYKKAEKLMEKMSDFAGKLSDSLKVLSECLNTYEELMLLCDALFSYARMRRDEDNANSQYQMLANKAGELYNKASACCSFLEPEIIKIDEKLLDEYLKDKRVIKFKHFIDEITRVKQHTLSKKEEKLLAMAMELEKSSDEIFSMFNDADITFPEILDEKNNKVELTKGRYSLFMENKNRRVREDAFNAFYDKYLKYKNTLTATYTSSIRAQRFYSNAREYDSTIKWSLNDDNIDITVYDNLIDSVNKNLLLLHKYVEIRRRILRIDKVHMYDLYVPLVKSEEKKYSFDNACTMVKEGLLTLGDNYIKILEKGFNSSWIDIYENKGKTSGAYSWGTYKSHPYVLMNYTGNLDSVFTLAHEMGHSVHTYLSNANQLFIDSNYKLFVAEVASTVNEILLLKYMLKNSQAKEEKIFLLNHFLETYRGTVFRQTMFAEFEKQMHKRYQIGESLSCEDICSFYYDLNKKYYGDSCHIDKKIEIEWARIPHFYRCFYVYKYATGFSAAAAICKLIEEEGQSAVNKYIEFLKSGGSDYPLNLLKKAGVDLSTSEPVNLGIQMFNKMLNEFDVLTR